MIALEAADDLLLVPFAERVGAVPHHLGGQVVGFRTGRGEVHLRHRHRRDLDQHLGEIDRRPMGLEAKGVVIGQLFHLRLGDSRQPLLAKTQRHRP